VRKVRRWKCGDVGVQDQKHRQIEYVIIDDGSTDGMQELATWYNGRITELVGRPSIKTCCTRSSVKLGNFAPGR